MYLIAVIDRSVDKERDKRFQSMAELASALERVYKSIAPEIEERRTLVDQTGPAGSHRSQELER